MKTAIKVNPHTRQGVRWTACEPFIENTRAILIHRVKHVTTHKIGERWPAHLAVTCWCGNSINGTKNITFLAEPPREKLVCARCEDAAVKAGLPTSAQLAGRHVHTGGLVAVARCCELEHGPDGLQGKP